MDMNVIVGPISQLINEDILVSIQASTGYTVGSGLKQLPQYSDAVTGYAQVQELSSSELRQTAGLNIQGAMRKLYARAPLNALIRPTSQGGDIVTIGSETWLVVRALEVWPTWSSALIVLQESQS